MYICAFNKVLGVFLSLFLRSIFLHTMLVSTVSIKHSPRKCVSVRREFVWCFVFDIYQMWQVYGASSYFGQYCDNVSTHRLVMIKIVVRNGSRFVNVAG